MKKKDGFPGQQSHVLPKRIQELMANNPLISDLYLTDIGYYPQASHHFRERQQGIEQSILIYNVAGEGIINIGQASYVLKPDQFIIIPKDIPHSYYSDMQKPWSIYWIHFTGVKSKLFDRFGLQPISIERSATSRINERLNLIDEIFRNLERGFGTETLEYVNMLLQHLLTSFTHVNQFRLVNEAVEKDPIGKSINYMLENLQSSLRLNQLAEEVKLSTSHYSRLFVEQTGHSPIDYFNQLKMQRACRFLDNSNLTVAEISRELGFGDQFYFSRIFKKVMSVSPLKYKTRNLS